MKRRDFFAAAGASAVALTTLPRGLAAQFGSAAVAAEQYEIGDFVLRRTALNLSVVHRAAPERLLWESEPDGNFLVGEQAVADIETFGRRKAPMTFATRSRRRYENPTIDAISAAGSTASVTGSLSGAAGSIGFTLTFKALSSSHLRFTISVGGNGASGVNRLQLRCGSVGRRGVLRLRAAAHLLQPEGIPPADPGAGARRRARTRRRHASSSTLFANRGGGNPLRHRGAGAAFHHRAVCARCSSRTPNISTFDMRQADRVRHQGLVGDHDRPHSPWRNPARPDRGLHRLCRPHARPARLGA